MRVLSDGQSNIDENFSFELVLDESRLSGPFEKVELIAQVLFLIFLALLHQIVSDSCARFQQFLSDSIGEKIKLPYIFKLKNTIEKSHALCHWKGFIIDGKIVLQLPQHCH